MLLISMGKKLSRDRIDKVLGSNEGPGIHQLSGIPQCSRDLIPRLHSWFVVRSCMCKWPAALHPIKNLMRVLAVSPENYFSPVGHSWHLLQWFFHGQLTDFPLANYSTLCVVVCGHRWLTVFHYWNMDRYRRAATGEFPENMEVYPDETPWTVQVIRR